ncbi:MAG: hypothetical protein AAF127_00510 [Pseudomonadota bacterium]
MHAVPTPADLQPDAAPLASAQEASAAPPKRMLRWRAAAVVLVCMAGVLALAWIDGGEEPIRPIVLEIEQNMAALEGNT